MLLLVPSGPGNIFTYIVPMLPVMCTGNGLSLAGTGKTLPPALYTGIVNHPSYFMLVYFISLFDTCRLFS